MDRNADWISKVSASAIVNMRKRINVLLVDHHEPAIDMLEHFFLKVTTVKFASTGLAILSKGKADYDLLLENISSPDACGFKLLQEAVKLDLSVILLFEEDDFVLTKRALEVGALLCIKKPITMEIARYFWQLVLWDKRRSASRKRDYNSTMQIGFGDQLNFSNYTIDQNASTTSEEYSHNINANIIKFENMRSDDIHEDHMVGFRSTKVWTEWTQELHDQFMAAVRKLGEGRCYPKDILDMMNVPGLTRMQVASHLQKCRSGSWIPPNKRKAKTSSGVAAKRLLIDISREELGFIPPASSSSSSSNQTTTHQNYYISTANHQYSENMEYYIPFPEHHDLTSDDQYFEDEFQNMDNNTFQTFCTSEQLPLTYNAADLNINNENVENWENTPKSRDNDDDDDDDGDDGDDDDDGKSADQMEVKKEEEE